VSGALAATGPTPLWYIARGSGIVSLVLLTAAVVLGVMTTVRWSTEPWPRFTVSYLHRNASLLAVVFIVVHVATLVLDGFAPIGWLDAVVPFNSPYRPIWLSLGAVAFDLMLAIIATSLLRRHVGARTWRTLHWLSYPLWILAVVHGLGTGTDTRTTLVLAVNALCVLAVVAAVWWRCREAVPRAGTRTGAIALTILGPLALVVWLAVGPLASGWAGRAGTPASLLASAAAANATSGTTGAASPTTTLPATTTLSPNFAATFAGTVTESDSGGATTVRINGTLTSGSAGSLQISIDARSQGGSLFVQSGTITLVDGSGHTLFTGTIADVRDGVLIAVSADPSTSERLSVNFSTFDPGAGRAAGSVQAVTGGSERGDGGGGGR
jgi:DMSO/TMAO reductase YedYZ heme-binding membrane subunit